MAEFRMDFRILRYFHNTSGSENLPPNNSRHAIYAIEEDVETADYLLLDADGCKIMPDLQGNFSVDVPFHKVFADGSGLTQSAYPFCVQFLRNSDADSESEYEEVWIQVIGTETTDGSPNPPIGWNAFARWVIVDRP